MAKVKIIPIKNIILICLLISTLSWINGIDSDDKTVKCPVESIGVQSGNENIPGSIIRVYSVKCHNQASRAVARFEQSTYETKQALEFKKRQNSWISSSTETMIACICLAIVSLLTTQSFYHSIKNGIRKTLE